MNIFRRNRHRTTARNKANILLALDGGGDAAAATTKKSWSHCFIMVLSLLVMIVLLSSTTLQQQQQRPRPLRRDKGQLRRRPNDEQVAATSNDSNNKEAATSADSTDSSTNRPSCIQSLLNSNNAILANSSLSEPSLSFPILLHPPTKDKFITKKILSEGTYEPEMEDFIARALPLDGGALNHTASGDASENVIWAVDIGANIGFHSMHMACRGAKVLAFEPAPDTAALVGCTARELLHPNNQNESIHDTSSAHCRRGGSITLIQAGASDETVEGLTMSRHPSSPGMTSFVRNSSFPLQELNSNSTTSNNNATISTHTESNTIRLVRAADILAKHGVPSSSSAHPRPKSLQLLKVDAEGYELHAFRGLDLTLYPFEYVTFEFFPQLLREAPSNKKEEDGPVELLLLIRDAGYECSYEKELNTAKEEGGEEGTKVSREELSKWIGGIRNHVNVFCQLY